MDPSGNVYTTGYFNGTGDFDPGAGIFNLTSAGGDDIFVSKLNSAGNFVWAKNMGGAFNDEVISIAVDASGNVYTTGYFDGTCDFDPGAGVFNLTPSGAPGFFDIFISKLNVSGDFVWAKKMGGTGDDGAFSIALDAFGNVYTTGPFGSTADFDPGPGVFNLTAAGNFDIFVSKLDASGNFIWAKNMGGAGDDEGLGLALDVAGNVYTTGVFSGISDFDPGAGVSNLTSAGGYDIFVSKLDASGNFVWVKGMGGVSDEEGHSIAIDLSGNVYTAGEFLATVDFDPGVGVANLTSAGSSDIFLVKLSMDNFRSKATGNWNNINTWESSSDNTTWSAATVIPDFSNSNSITIQNGHIVTVTVNTTVDQTSISAGGAVVVNPAVVLTVNDGTGSDLNVSSGAILTLKSTSTGTASIGTSAGSISGNVTVERYTSNRRAWRLLGIPFSASTQTIKTSWMENGSTSAGFGTQITTFTGDANAANFDAARPSSSIRTYSSDNFNSDAAHTPNTTNLITASQAYFLFVRGDRSVDRTTTVSPGSITTLRITGALKQGNLAGVGVTGTGFSLIQNPYPSSIDFDAIKGIAANSGISTFYVWDATMGTVGQYRTVQITGSSPFTYTATPGGANNNWRFLESGTAFFVAGNRTVDFTEATKASGTPPSSMLRTASGSETELSINLNVVNADNTNSLTDGVRMVFDDNYAAGIDKNDAKKITGFDINLGIVNNKEILSIEKRPLPGSDEIISLNLTNSSTGNYQFEMLPSNFLSRSLFAYLKDNYLKTYTPVNLTTDTKVNFSVTTDTASAAANRFSIVFTKTAISPSNPAIVVYPNPVQNGVVTLLLNNMPKGIYSIRLINNLGQTVLTRQINHAEGTATETFAVNKVRGSFMLEVVKPDNSKFTNKLIIN